MSVRTEKDKHGKKQYVTDQRWSDGRRFRRKMPNKKTAHEIDTRIAAAKIDGTWRELRRELDGGTACTTTVKDYKEHYSETYCKPHNRAWKRKLSSLGHIGRLLGLFRMENLELRDVNQFVVKRLKEEVAAATVNRDLTVLRHMFQFAVTEGDLTLNPIRHLKKLKEYRAERPRVTESKMLRIVRYLPFPVGHMVVFIWETGCRPSEALGLERDYVDFENQTAIFNLRKGGDNALVALTTRAVEAIEAVPELPGCPYVFWNPHTRDRYQRINETFSRARKKAGLSHIQLKDFRRELGIVLAESGEPLHVAKTQLGHSSIRTTEKYYAKYSPEFAVERARPVLENRGRKTGGEPPSENPSKNGTSNLLDFQQFRRGFGGGERIRTAE